MNKKHLAAATLIALAGLYLGCTNPQSAVDPRVQAGNTTGTSPSTPTFSKANATGYWMYQDIEGGTAHGIGGRLVLKQQTDGTLFGQFNDYVISNASNTNGVLKFEADGKTFEGTISEDGVTVSLPGASSHTFKCTRLF